MSGLGRFRKGCAAAAACYCADTGSPGKAALSSDTGRVSLLSCDVFGLSDWCAV